MVVVSFDSAHMNMVLLQWSHLYLLYYYHIIKNFCLFISSYISLRFPILRKILKGIANSEDPMEILMSILGGEKPSKKKKKKNRKKKNKNKKKNNKENNENENEENKEEEPEPEENSGSEKPENES